MRLQDIILASFFSAVALADRPPIIPKKPGEDSWQVRHMREEHLVDDFDALSFFTFHDADNSKSWTKNDILNLYGILKDEMVGDGTGQGILDQSRQTSQETKDYVVKTVLDMIDLNNDGEISLDEWRVFSEKGGELPDFGYAGHHGDFETEFDIHHARWHFENNDPDMKIVHPEDVEHERLYHAYEHGDDPDNHKDPPVGSWAKLENIPVKFRKQQFQKQ